MDEEEVIDKKAQKKAEKAKKKEAKKAAKEAKKAQGDSEVEEESGGSKFLIAVVTLIIIIVWLGILAFLVKTDVGGFGSSVLHPILKDVPYVNKILPEVETEEDVNDDTYGYSSLAEAVEQIKALELQIQELQSGTESDKAYIAELESQIAALRVYEENQAAFEEEKAEYYEQVVFGDEAPEVEEYQAYYESIDPAYAEELYKQVVQQIQASEEVEDYAKTYSSMKPANAASILENMTDDMNLVASILQNMDVESRANILGAMDPTIAANITKIMEP